MYSRAATADELGLGFGGDSDDVDGLFGDVWSAVKSVAKPAATFVGGAVGTLVAPGVGTAIGASVGGYLGGQVSSSGGGGGGPAPAPRGPGFSGAMPSVDRLGQQRAAGFASRPASTKKAMRRSPAEMNRLLQSRLALGAQLQSASSRSAPLSTGAKVAIGVGGAAALGGLGYLAWLALA